MSGRILTPSIPARRTVVFATNNKNKVRELRALFAGAPIDLLPLSEATPQRIDVVEDADTFEGNARKKARTVAAALALPTLADDSGLEVDMLEGRPGVRSARYAGESATDAANNVKLLSELDTLDPHGPRIARFRCVLSFVDPVRPTELIETSGACEGTIALSPRGTGGFGYDPIFVVRDVPGARTMAEITDVEKNQVSHRAKAAVAMREQLLRWFVL